MRRAFCGLGICLALIAVGCGGGKRQDPILALSAEEALTQGKMALEAEKFFKARRLLTHAFEVAPNTALGREALLLAADTFFLQGGEANLVQAEAKYRDYMNRFPTSDFAPYVQFQLGNCLAQRTKRADRDQSSTGKALAAYEEVLRLYPTSEYAARAREEIRAVRNQLAEHEYLVGKFYLGYGIYVAAIERLEGVLEDYQDYGEKDKVYLTLGQSYVKAGLNLKAFNIFEKLRREFPESPYVKDIPKLALGKEGDSGTEEGGAAAEQTSTEAKEDG
ncbi:MAG: outer membrane protein assembly factor BamD [Acidobacteria bacterium]|nr:outer membrane protein assembly factor BamD [Acidobacteriota bacterium]